MNINCTNCQKELTEISSKNNIDYGVVYDECTYEKLEMHVETMKGSLVKILHCDNCEADYEYRFESKIPGSDNPDDYHETLLKI